nr:hypothetical protein [Deltaproteobacteria bacterium]MDQ3301266.1 hypothetical protein [Myxococcota bacterium]
MTTRAKMLAIGLVLVAAGVVLYVLQRSDAREAPAVETAATGSAQRTTHRGSATLPPRRTRGATPRPSDPAAAKPGSRALVGLFDTGVLCEQHNAVH